MVAVDAGMHLHNVGVGLERELDQDPPTHARCVEYVCVHRHASRHAVGMYGA